MLVFFPTLKDTAVTSWWHFSANETIELTGSRATGQTWLLQPCVVEGESQIAAGRYEDRMEKGADGQWRFAERCVRFFFWSSLAEGWDAGRFSWPGALGAADPRTLGQLAEAEAAR
jgi:hypothetical protein